MMIIGCDYHPGFQQIAFVDSETGELNERRLGHREEAEQFYRELKEQGALDWRGRVRCGIPCGRAGHLVGSSFQVVCGYARWCCLKRSFP